MGLSDVFSSPVEGSLRFFFGFPRRSKELTVFACQMQAGFHELKMQNLSLGQGGDGGPKKGGNRFEPIKSLGITEPGHET